MIGIGTHLMAGQSKQFPEANAAFSDAVDAYAKAPTPATVAVMGCSFAMYRAAAEGQGKPHA
jgi:hypothetical protein